MMIDEKLLTFIKDMDYLNNEHVLGILFYGSYLTGFNTKNSDIDLHIIFDDSIKENIIRGNKIIDGVRIEYFEKPIGDILKTIDDDFNNQNNASLLIFGKSKIIYQKDNLLDKLQEYVNEKFKEPLQGLNGDEAKEYVCILNNRMEKLEKYAKVNDPYFEHLYHLTIDKIRIFYHNLIGMPYIETSKGFRVYKDLEYRKSFCIDKLPEDEFIKLYFEMILNNQLDKNDKFKLIDKMYSFAKRNVLLDKDEYRINIKSRNIGFDAKIIEPNIIEENNDIKIPPATLKRILKFIKEMDYLNNEHVLGVIVYGSSLTGFNTKDSDIDLQIIFDDFDPNHLIRGLKTIDGVKIEYFERPIRDIYLEIENGYLNQNNALLSIIGTGSIVFFRDDKIRKLKQYAINRFKTPMPPLSLEDSREQVSIINNRMEKLEEYALDDNPYFDHFYHLVIEKIRKFYHKAIGIPKIATSKVYRIYTDSDYRNSMYKENPEPEFVNMYLNLITIKCENKLEKLKMIKEFYNYATRNIKLENDYRISIKSRNISTNNQLSDGENNIKKLSLTNNMK